MANGRAEYFPKIFWVVEAATVGYLGDGVVGLGKESAGMLDACLAQEFGRRDAQQLFHLSVETRARGGGGFCHVSNIGFGVGKVALDKQHHTLHESVIGCRE